jgi:Fe-S oxidoreductase
LDAGRIRKDAFATRERLVKLHGHCHQKALASVEPTVRMLETVPGQRVEVIPSGCCGMAGAFGYEREHFGVSNQVGELVLFPAVRASGADTIIAAPGTSCRHQIHDGTSRRALHPAEVMREALAVDLPAVDGYS